MGVPLVQRIGDNACFCCGGRCILVECNYALVICSVGQIFENLLFLVLCFTCSVHTRLISYTLHIILLHVHLNKQTQQALCSSVDCSPLHSTYLTAHTKHKRMVKNFSDRACYCFHVCINLAIHVNFMHHSLCGTSCIIGK